MRGRRLRWLIYCLRWQNGLNWKIVAMCLQIILLLRVWIRVEQINDMWYEPSLAFAQHLRWIYWRECMTL